MTDRTPAEQAAEALREARQVLQAWTLRYDFIDEALATLTAEAASARDPDEIIGDAIAKANPAKWEDVPSRVSPDREALARHIDRLRDDLKRVSATRELTGFEILASTIADACDDLIRAPAPDREALARRLTLFCIDWDQSDMADGEPPRDGLTCRDIREAAEALRLPAQAEEMANEVDRIHHEILDNYGRAFGHLHRAAEMLRRLSSPSPVGEWRPIATAPALDTLTVDLRKIGAPYDGDLYILLCEAGDPEDSAVFATEDAALYRTIGYWQEDQGWLMAGWDWCQDQFRDGHGRPVFFAALPALPQEKPT